MADRERANHVTIAQLALGAWQKRGEDEAWLPVFADGAEWLAEALDDAGGLQYLFAMPHTFEISPPWYSAMAQGEAASVFVRAALTLGDSTFADAAERAIQTAERGLFDRGAHPRGAGLAGVSDRAAFARPERMDVRPLGAV